jgi:hypothetical protein
VGVESMTLRDETSGHTTMPVAILHKLSTAAYSNLVLVVPVQETEGTTTANHYSNISNSHCPDRNNIPRLRIRNESPKGAPTQHESAFISPRKSYHLY